MTIKSIGVPLGARLLRLLGAFSIPLMTVGSAQAEPVENWRLAQEFGSSRTLLYTLIKDRPQGAAGTVRSSLLRFGYGPEPLKQKGQWSLSLKPDLRYDENINGGHVTDRYYREEQNRELNVYLPVDKEDFAEKGLTVGGGTMIGYNKTLAEGLAVLPHASAFLRRSTKSGNVVKEARAGVCLQYTGQYLGYFDSCLGKSWTKRANSDTRHDTARFTFGKVRSYGGRIFDLSATLSYYKPLTYEQWRGQLSARTIIPNRGFFSAGVTVGEKDRDHFNLRNSGYLSYGWLQNGKPLTVTVSRSFYSGDEFNPTAFAFFGFDPIALKSRTVKVSLRRKVTKRFSVTAYAEFKKSSVKEWSDRNFGMNLSFSGWNPF